MKTEQVTSLLTVPPEIILYIFTFLDLPDLEQLSVVSPVFRDLAADPALHRMRVLVVAPSRIRHFLFAHGGHMRPTVGDLVQRGVMRGLGIERRWRNGLYFYSPQSVKQYWTSINLQRAHARHMLSTLLCSRSPDPAQAAQQTTRVVLPDGAVCSSHISRVLLPVVHQLTWRFRRDRLARMCREKQTTFNEWFETGSRGLYPENERVRLALCPGVRRIISFYNELSL